MYAKCCKCNEYLNISTKTDLSKPYSCPKCEVKEKAIEKKSIVKSTKHKKRIDRVSKVLMNNKQKFTSI